MTTILPFVSRPAVTPAADAEPEVRGQLLLRKVDEGLQRLERFASASPAMSPLAQSGAIANLTFLIASVTGIVLLIWYSPSVHQAYASMQDIEANWFANLFRSLHRYSSDACMMFVLIHAAKIVAARRFTGARWLAWVTGLLALSMMGLVGWLGYWLVWDQPAQLIAEGTSRMLDILPIFPQPLSRSFLTDDTVNSLLFFVVFFAHMLLPMAVVLALWLHLARLSRAKWMTKGPMTWWVTGSLVVVSSVVPATMGEPARMTEIPGQVPLDLWYTLPILITERLGAASIWGLLLFAGAILATVPWWSTRRRIRPAFVDESRCNACRRCTIDCPYGAVSMVPRTDGRDIEARAEVDPSRCIGCGICTASCDSVAIDLDWFDVLSSRNTLDRWLAESPGSGIAFVCAHSVAGELHIDNASGECRELPGWRAMVVPCAGWIHALTVERVLRRGGSQVAIATCASGDCRYREGPDWLRERLDQRREPYFRPDRADRSKVHVLATSAGHGRRFAAEAARILETGRPAPRPGSGRRRFATAALWLGLLAVMVAGSRVPYGSPQPAPPELVVSFEVAGRVGETVRTLSEEEKQALPVHMRRDRIVERQRAAVRLWVIVDGRVAVDRTYQPAGLWDDGISTGIATVPMVPGEHDVEVAVGDADREGEWTWQEARRVSFSAGKRRVILLERGRGFTWH